MVNKTEDLLDVIAYGDKQRTVAATKMNNYSSRSHSLFIIEIVQKFPDDAGKKGKLNLVDLAGSEKISKTGAAGETLEEAKKINLSLSALGKVIHALAHNSEHISYRESKLTRILQESLSGNCKTSLLVACSPFSTNKAETNTTLKFATRAKTIKTKYKMNMQNSPETLLKIVEELTLQLAECKEELKHYKQHGIPMAVGGPLEEKPQLMQRYRKGLVIDAEDHYAEFEQCINFADFNPLER